MAAITVIGSANIDLVVAVDRLPQAGETVPGGDLMTTFGGKGANQAVAAARMGAAVSFVGRVGSDAYADQYQTHLRAEGIALPLTDPVPNTPTGSALILVDARGQNIIAVSPGANGRFAPEDLDGCEDVLRASDRLVVQAEIPLDTLVRAIHMANAANTPVVFNPSPVPERFPWGEVRLDYLIVNETEAQVLSGVTATDTDGLADSARTLLDRSIDCVVVTRGADPTIAVTAKETLCVETRPITPVDTVGAGDSFAGAFAVATAEGMALANALRFANGAGGLAATRRGAQVSLPTRAELEAFLRGAEA